jgi:hypothetical protein
MVDLICKFLGVTFRPELDTAVGDPLQEPFVSAIEWDPRHAEQR